MLTTEECQRLTEYISAAAKGCDVPEAYWIDDDADSNLYCHKCAQTALIKSLARYRRLPKSKKSEKDGPPRLSGGYSIEEDSQPFCDTCGDRLWASYTEECCDNELEHFLVHGFDTECLDDCQSMERVMSSSRDWERTLNPKYASKSAIERAQSRYVKLHELGRKILDTLNARNL